MKNYDDIINLPHPISKTHPQMSMADRAAQFNPFAALNGYTDAIGETGRLVDEKLELSDYEKEEINKKLNILKENKKNVLLTITYFIPDENKVGGKYITEMKEYKLVNEFKQKVEFNDGTYVNFNDILTINCDLFKENL